MNDELKHRLYHYQALPSAEVWNNITEELDTKGFVFTERLKNYEVTAPEEVWNGIVGELDAKQTPVIPFTTRYARPLKYGVAGASLIFAVILVNLLFFKKSVSEETANTSPASNQPNSVQSSTASTSESNNVSHSSDSNSDELTYADRGKNIPVRVKNLKAGNVKSNSTIAELRSQNIPSIQSDLLERYSIFSNNTGESFRVSKKLFDLFICSEINEYCKLNIEMMKGKVASPSLIASADFSGVLDLLQSMNNQQNR